MTPPDTRLDPDLAESDPKIPAYRRGLGQRISLAAAYLCYAAAIACLVGLGVWTGELGGNHPIIASLGASVVFFVGAGVVLHVMGRANLPSLCFSRDETRPPGQT